MKKYKDMNIIIMKQEQDYENKPLTMHTIVTFFFGLFSRGIILSIYIAQLNL